MKTIDKIYQDQYFELKEMAQKITGCSDDCSLADDLCHEVYFILDGKPYLEKSYENEDHLFLFARVMINEFNRNRSNFNKTFRPDYYALAPNYVYNLEEIPEEDDTISFEERITREKPGDLVLDNISKLTGYEQKLLFHYFEEGKSYRKIAEAAKIHYVTICLDLNKALRKLRNLKG